MVKTFRGIWELYNDDPEVAEAQILDYLAAHYAPTQSSSRRAQLNSSLMPPARSQVEIRPGTE